MKVKKFLAAFGVALFLGTSTLASASAANAAEAAQSTESVSEPSGPAARKHVIVRKFRIYQNKQQWRDWSETYGYWLQSFWCDMPK